MKSFFKQYYLYARGDGKAGLWLKRHLVRYSTYLVALPLLVAAALGARPWEVRGLSVALLALGIVAYTRTPYRRLAHGWGPLSNAQRVQAASLVPMIRVVGDCAKMLGYPMGVWWRIRRWIRHGRLK